VVSSAVGAVATSRLHALRRRIGLVIAFLHTPFDDFTERRIATELTVGNRPLNLLVIANNARNVAANKPLGLGSAAGRADIVLVLHIDPMERGIWAITVPRDTLIAQPRLRVRGVADLTGLPTDSYLAMNFAVSTIVVSSIRFLKRHHVSEQATPPHHRSKRSARPPRHQTSVPSGPRCRHHGNGAHTTSGRRSGAVSRRDAYGQLY
jgi:hypothetical protein